MPASARLWRTARLIAFLLAVTTAVFVNRMKADRVNLEDIILQRLNPERYSNTLSSALFNRII
jgi:hypothetical protein